MPAEARYPVLSGPVLAETEVHSSRFICALSPVSDEAEAHAFIQTQREAYPDATHHCWAFLVGPPASSRKVGFSDDGEPHNSAGRPMLNVLSHCGVGDLVAVVIRYFGGTKLGRGGLVRAYGGAVQHALQDAPLSEKVDWVMLRVTLDYALVGAVERLYPGFEVEILGQEFGAQVVQQVRVPRPGLPQLEQALADASRGGITVEVDEA